MGKREKNPPRPLHPPKNNSLEEGEKKEKTQPLHLETTKPLPSLMSIKKQPLIEKVPALQKIIHLSHSLSLSQGAEKKNPLDRMGYHPPLPPPTQKKIALKKKKKKKNPQPSALFIKLHI